MSKKSLSIIGITLGIVFICFAVLYFVTPAKSLPAFFPGHEAGSLTKHVKHGVAALFLGLGCFAFAWFQGGKKSPPQKEN